MTRMIVALIVGSVAASYLSFIPSLGWLLLALLAALVMLCCCRRLHSKTSRQVAALPCAFAIGMVWVLIPAKHYLDGRRVAAQAEQLELLIEVDGLPVKKSGNRLSFQGTVLSPAPPVTAGTRLQIAWLEPPSAILPGDQWRLRLRLRPVRGSLNPVGFDIERWGFVNQLHANAYVLSGRRVTVGKGLDRWRERTGKRLQQRYDGPAGAILAALAVGDRRSMSTQHWQVLQSTGTNHLMAISGLHIGLIATLGLLLGKLMQRLLAKMGGPLPHWTSAVGPVLAITLALAYAFLAGFSLPTRRALIMLSVVMLGLGLRRTVQPDRSLSTAALLVIVLDPLAPLRPGFWLSFGAVAGLLLGFAGRHRSSAAGQEQRLGAVLKHGAAIGFARAQWVVTIGLFPCLLIWSLPVSPVAPLVNAIAIPWVGVSVLPPLLLGTSLLDLCPALADWLLAGAHWSTQQLWWGLSVVAEGSPAWHAPRSNGLCLLLAGIGAVALLLPRGLPARYLGIIGLLPALMSGLTKSPRSDEVRVHVLDVGQGLAALIETHESLIVYDTGPASRWGWTAGETIVAPFIEQYLQRDPDLVIVSHGDSDHAGGRDYLRRHWPQARWLEVEPGAVGQRCVAGLTWQTSDVAFRILHPGSKLPYLGNDSSCVLSMRVGQQRLLFSGDISTPVEHRLLDSGLRQHNWLLVPHHGSRSSSHEAFVQQVDADWAITATGASNRFGMPHQEVLARYRQQGSVVFDTAAHGYMRFAVRADEIVLEWAQRVDQARLWHWPSIDP